MMNILGFLFPFLPLTPFLSLASSTPPAQTVYVQTLSSSSNPIVTVVTGNQVSSTTAVIKAPYGVKTELVSNNGQTYATTTPLTQQDVTAMQQQQETFQAQMNQVMQDQEKLFQDMWQ